jgi:pimeloyl-ACP methyl ester carboxylesterase
LFDSEWLNSPGPYVQYTYDPDPKLIAVIRRHGFAFDGEHWFWIPRTKQGGEQATLIVKRAPLWTYPTKSVPAEKAQRKKAAQLRNQKKLVLEVFA